MRAQQYAYPTLEVDRRGLMGIMLAKSGAMYAAKINKKNEGQKKASSLEKNQNEKKGENQIFS